MAGYMNNGGAYYNPYPSVSTGYPNYVQWSDKQMDAKSVIITILSTLLASAGFWAFITNVVDKKSARSKMLLGLGHDRIMYLGMKYIERGKITQGEYENLYKYLYEPYKKMGGNGTAERLMKEVDKLEIVPDSYLFENGGLK